MAHHLAVGRRLHAEAFAHHGRQALSGLERLLALSFELLGGSLRAWRRRQTRRQSIAALRALDDRLLRDIGMHRSEIPAIVEASEAAEASGEVRRGHDSVKPLREAAAADGAIANDNETPDLARAACG